MSVKSKSTSTLKSIILGLTGATSSGGDRSRGPGAAVSDKDFQQTLVSVGLPLSTNRYSSSSKSFSRIADDHEKRITSIPKLDKMLPGYMSAGMAWNFRAESIHTDTEFTKESFEQVNQNFSLIAKELERVNSKFTAIGNIIDRSNAATSLSIRQITVEMTQAQKIVDNTAKVTKELEGYYRKISDRIRAMESATEGRDQYKSSTPADLSVPRETETYTVSNLGSGSGSMASAGAAGAAAGGTLAGALKALRVAATGIFAGAGVAWLATEWERLSKLNSTKQEVIRRWQSEGFHWYEQLVFGGPYSHGPARTNAHEWLEAETKNALEEANKAAREAQVHGDKVRQGAMRGDRTETLMGERHSKSDGLYSTKQFDTWNRGGALSGGGISGDRIAQGGKSVESFTGWLKNLYRDWSYGADKKSPTVPSNEEMMKNLRKGSMGGGLNVANPLGMMGNYLYGKKGGPGQLQDELNANAPRMKTSDFDTMFDRRTIEAQKSQFMKFGELPPGFEFLPGHKGRLGQPEAVAAGGAMPLGGYGGVGGAPGAPGGGYGGSGGSYGGGGGQSYGGGAATGYGTSSGLPGSDEPLFKGEQMPTKPYGTLKSQRERFAAEMKKNPQLRRTMMAMAISEVGPKADDASIRAVMETMVNRAAAQGKSLGEILKRHRGQKANYYQPYFDGSFDKRMAYLNSNPDAAKRLDGLVNDVIGGSNDSKLGTDNSSANVARSARRTQTVTTVTATGETISRKDRDSHSQLHGAAWTKNNQRWATETMAAMEEEEQRKSGEPKQEVETPTAKMNLGGPKETTLESRAAELGLTEAPVEMKKRGLMDFAKEKAENVQYVYNKDEQRKIKGVNSGTMQKFQKLQSLYGGKIGISSGYRDPKHNARVGGAKGSQHIRGTALDIQTGHLSREERIKIIKMASALGFTGIGVYNNNIHIDTGPKRAWGPSYGRESVPSWAQEAIIGHEKNKHTMESIKDIISPNANVADAPAPVTLEVPRERLPGIPSQKDVAEQVLRESLADSGIGARGGGAGVASGVMESTPDIERRYKENQEEKQDAKVAAYQQQKRNEAALGVPEGTPIEKGRRNAAGDKGGIVSEDTVKAQVAGEKGGIVTREEKAPAPPPKEAPRDRSSTSTNEEEKAAVTKDSGDGKDTGDKSGSGRTSEGSGEPSWSGGRHNPETQQAEPGSGGYGSYGRCFV